MAVTAFPPHSTSARVLHGTARAPVRPMVRENREGRWSFKFFRITFAVRAVL